MNRHHDELDFLAHEADSVIGYRMLGDARSAQHVADRARRYAVAALAERRRLRWALAKAIGWTVMAAAMWIGIAVTFWVHLPQ